MKNKYIQKTSKSFNSEYYESRIIGADGELKIVVTSKDKEYAKQKALELYRISVGEKKPG